jgi:hypothetical protein
MYSGNDGRSKKSLEINQPYAIDAIMQSFVFFYTFNIEIDPEQLSALLNTALELPPPENRAILSIFHPISVQVFSPDSDLDSPFVRNFLQFFHRALPDKGDMIPTDDIAFINDAINESFVTNDIDAFKIAFPAIVL